MVLSAPPPFRLCGTRLYAAMRLFVNFFQPSFKLTSKARDGGTGQEALSLPSDTLSTVDGRPTDERGGARPSTRAAGQVGTSSPAEADPCAPAAARGYRGQARL